MFVRTHVAVNSGHSKWGIGGRRLYAKGFIFHHTHGAQIRDIHWDANSPTIKEWARRECAAVPTPLSRDHKSFYGSDHQSYFCFCKPIGDRALGLHWELWRNAMATATTWKQSYESDKNDTCLCASYGLCWVHALAWFGIMRLKPI